MPQFSVQTICSSNYCSKECTIFSGHVDKYSYTQCSLILSYLHACLSFHTFLQHITTSGLIHLEVRQKEKTTKLSFRNQLYYIFRSFNLSVSQTRQFQKHWKGRFRLLQKIALPGRLLHSQDDHCTRRLLYQTIAAPEGRCTRRSLYQKIATPENRCARRSLYQKISTPEDRSTRRSLHLKKKKIAATEGRRAAGCYSKGQPSLQCYVSFVRPFFIAQYWYSIVLP